MRCMPQSDWERQVLKNMNYAVIDLETTANDQAPLYYKDKVYKAPANYKDPAKIEAYQLERRHEDQERAALTWWTGKIICATIRSLSGRFTTKTWVGDNELAILVPLLDLIAEQGEQIQIIGMCADTFDRPFLIGRCMAHDLGVPPGLKTYRPIGDVNDIFGFSHAAGQRGSLSDYAFGLQIAGKTGRGSDIAGWYNEALLGNAQRWQDIAKYNVQDVDIVAEMLTRYHKAYVPTSSLPRTTAQPNPEAVPMNMEGIF